MTIFEKATKQKLRFQSDRGLLTTEQLWDMSLASLDSAAKHVNRTLKTTEEESFVEDLRENKENTENTLRLDILKHVIAVKVKARDEAKNIKEKAEKRRVLLDALSSKENEELKSMSKADILKKLEEL